ncbi:MAG: 50S ribosomal protein L10 [Alphaproteobacteria bacterium]|nr:50S ribosomal protein L10 [Alphaproteobacteria bacterium]
MGLSRAEKEQVVATWNERFQNSEMVVVTQYAGSTVSEMQELRGSLRENGAEYKVLKNKLAKLAIKGTKFEHLNDMFTGPTGIAISTDPVAAAKVTQKFADSHKKFLIIGGALGEKTLDVAAVEALSKLPSLDEIRGTLVGLIQAPATKIAGVLQAPAGQLARVCGAYGATGE